MDGKSVAAAHMHKRIRGAAMLNFPPRHMHMRLVSALSAARGVCVLFCLLAEEFHIPAHPGKC